MVAVLALERAGVLAAVQAAVWDLAKEVERVGSPSCFYMPNPPYSEEARKAKYSGVVLVEAVVTVDGRVMRPRVERSPGLGLDETTVNTMRTWRCKPAVGPGGKPVATLVQFEVNFRLY